MERENIHAPVIEDNQGQESHGAQGMSLWEIFVLGQVRLCMDTSYDQLHYMSNFDSLLRGVLGVLPSDYSLGKQYEYQNIYDTGAFWTTGSSDRSTMSSWRWAMKCSKKGCFALKGR